jgi:1-phosphofructokinase family hexose kinase
VKVLALIGKNELHLYQNFLKQRNIDFEFVSVDGKTRSNKTILDPEKKTITHIRYPGFSISMVEINSLINLIKKYVQPKDILIISGSVPNGVPISVLKQFVVSVRENQGQVVIDTSGPFLQELANLKPLLIKVNFDELKEMVPELVENPKYCGINLEQSQNDQDIKEIVALMKRISPCSFNIITLGKSGSVSFNQDEILYAVGHSASFYNVGCGDAFLGGLVVGLNRGHSFEETIRLATACGAANTLTIGAGLLRKEDVEVAEKKVQMKKIL